MSVELLDPAPAGYSHVASVGPGRLVWTSGQIALDASGELVEPGDWELQTRAVMRNLTRVLESARVGWGDVFKLTIFVVDTSALANDLQRQCNAAVRAQLRTIRDEFIDKDRPPTSSLVQVAGLFRADLLIEIEAVAAAPA